MTKPVPPPLTEESLRMLSSLGLYGESAAKRLEYLESRHAEAVKLLRLQSQTHHVWEEQHAVNRAVAAFLESESCR